ncbi:2-C-methyl-D-erythritol 4-phosphate cytidylyltransferase [Arthrobacter stackebrandtii]|uniref:2-C-methyl-D-erythritol 4-phosphate cytidylyltransferase n=1 Tax=Arthrobacter stackebrandtii TaxID=272161 RepID=A0ABS4YTF6_9MICC|nr:2-C-methyl-D-erythritol 4-phosphate cytidylyltransferase [Arthrobacter stackebrandtii]MBP2412082.1 2-C-methyl-D-erythritol 4-phosphate cytidylyltransferase [Arthrobacter stackebrandtii]PYH01888.1 2-C-methyl-D-erythritol 4-phosphate cytidylyltransferase [Arthrobacter stackebrandtii]
MSEVDNGSCAVVIVAAGSGQRLGHGVPKARVPLGREPLLAHAVKGVLKAGIAAQICVAIPADDAELAEICRGLGAEAATAGVKFTVVDGGADRSASVAAALAEVADGTTTVMVHDAARPLTPSGVFNRVAAALRDGATAVIPALAVTDTIKTVQPANLPRTGAGLEKVVGTPSRDQLRAVQTPQGFDLATLRRAHENALTFDAETASRITDDAMLVEALGDEVYVVQGSTHSFKVTTPMDLLLAEAMLEGPLRPRWVEG